MKNDAFGRMAAFGTEEEFIAALRSLRRAGYRHIETFTPYRVELEEAMLPQRTTPIPWIMLAAGILGGGGAFFMQWYATRDYPLNIGGRPINSWPSFIPITFELTVLTAALVGVGAFLWLAGFPRLDHPVFSDPRFQRATQDRFFICLRSDDPKYSDACRKDPFAGTHPESVEEVFP
jgi:Protein of unknown function (DUF3341)